MSASEDSFEQSLAEAAEKTSKYEWMDAAALYQRALDRLPQISTLETARVTDVLGKSWFKGAFQSEDREEFKRRMQLAEAWYEKARILYEKTGSDALAERSRARGMFATFWIRDEASDRRAIIEQSISSAKLATQNFERGSVALAETLRDLLTYLSEAWLLARKRDRLRILFDDALHFGERSIAEFELIGDNEGLIECLSITADFLLESGQVGEPSGVGEIREKARIFIDHISEISAKTDTPHSVSLVEFNAAEKAYRFDRDSTKALHFIEAAITTAQKTRDLYWIGNFAWNSIGIARNAGEAEEDPDRRREFYEKAMRLSPLATKIAEILSHDFMLAKSLEMLGDCHLALARFVETGLEGKKAHLETAVELGRKGYRCRDYTPLTGHALGKALYFSSLLETDPREKAKLLAEALHLREETVGEADLLYPGYYYQGIQYNYLALIKAELSALEQDPKIKVELLRNAVQNMQQCVELCVKWVPPFPAAFQASYEEWYGDILLQFYRLTSEPSAPERAVGAYEDSIEHLTQSKLVGPVAALHWKIARVYDAAGHYEQAARVFRRAAEEYRLSSDKIPGSKAFFAELASYMESWSLIEEARLQHVEEQYLLAAENYAKAATSLQSSRARHHLSRHYMACFLLEQAEALSRQEKPENSIECFRRALDVFEDSRSEVDKRLNDISYFQEIEELKTWNRVAEGREKLCHGRIELEEGKLLDRKGQENASSAKYAAAAEIFNALLAETQSPQARKELKTLVLHCEASAKMKQAEARASPELYAEAADSFSRIEETATGKRYHLMALANASICRALKAGTLFRRTRNTQLYSEIKKQLETATDYYQEANLQSAADWARATGNLFDALLYMADAATEKESKKKTELYHQAEKHLELAAKLYDKSGFSSKKQEALKHLERARQEKEILLTPVEALAEHPAAQAIPVSPVSLLRDQPLGLERFETANVVGNLTVTQREINVGSDITLELEMANVGKTAATLIKLENIAPEGLEIDRERVQHRVEDNFIDLKGKRLEYLKTHEVRIPLRAKQKGGFELRPRILFVDEKGDYRSYQFEPAGLTVRELGISGWLRGR